MNMALNMPYSSILDAIGWAVVHFLWQGVVIGGLAYLAMTGLQRRSASERYSLALFALVSCAAAFLVTLAIELNGRIAPPLVIGAGSATSVVGGFASPSPLMNIIAWIWAVGAGMLGVRVFVQWLLGQRLKSLQVSQPDQRWLEIFASLTRELGVAKTPRFLQSAIADVPMVIGFVAPVVLVPVSSFTSLTPEQLKAVLAHELWHIRRRDHWANAFQIAIETILFFHPAVWWLSSQVRLERENCCDDAAVRSAGNPRVLAEALTRLETLRIHIPATALSSNGGPLMNRIARMIGAPVPRNRSGPGWLPAAALGAGMLVLSAIGIAHAAVTTPRSDEEIVLALRDAVATSTLSQDDARELYSMLAYSGSEAEANGLAMLARVYARIDAEAAAGRVSSRDAAAQKVAARERIDRAQQVAFGVDVLGKTPSQSRFDVTVAMFQAQVQAGEISQKEADSRIEAVKQRMATESAESGKPVGVLKEMRVIAGTPSAKDAEAKMAALRLHLTQAQPSQDDFEKLRTTLTGKVLAGQMTADEARSKLTVAKQQWFGPGGTEKAPSVSAAPADSTKPTRAGFIELDTALKAKVAAGEIKQDEMDAQLKAYRERLIKEHAR